MNRPPHFQSAPDMGRIFSQRYRNENELARELTQLIQISSEDHLRADALARLITERLRLERSNQSGLDAILAEFPLNEPEGKALLNLSEALLRIPDKHNADQLIYEQLHAANWQGHRGHSPSWLVNLASWGLSLAESMSGSASKPIAREAIKQAIEWLAQYFVIADNIKDASERQQADFLYSFDILGEAALSQAESDRYFAKYAEAIHCIGKQNQGAGIRLGAGISIKLSALHPRFQSTHQALITHELYPRLLELALLAKQYDIGLTIDAEESDRLETSLKLFAQLALDEKLGEWAGLGIAVQAYQKCALSIIQWLSQLSRQRPIMVRLVKGAYWDSEIKTAQKHAHIDYPVFTHKTNTELSYIACAQALLQAEHRIYPQFATHNPFTFCLVHQIAGEKSLEFQSLFGMGETVYSLANELGLNRPCRIYAPVGNKSTLLPYLIRRFLENGANTSFVHQLLKPESIKQFSWSERHQLPTLAKPFKLFPHHHDFFSLDWSHEPDVQHFYAQDEEHKNHTIIAMPMMGHGLPELYEHKRSINPAEHRQHIGLVNEAGLADIEKALSSAANAVWGNSKVSERADLLDRTAHILSTRSTELMSILIVEAGKSPINAQNEVREAIDFCHYYAQEARQQWQTEAPTALGTVVTISPWNFPLAIYVGQVASALVAGNCVIAKPAAETPLVAMLATRCFYEAGCSRQVLQFIPGGAAAGAALVLDRRCDGVLFTGSYQTAYKITSEINHLAQQKPFISETSSVNCMVVDSTAHIDQVCNDVLTSAFDSAGQRCSALRILFLQAEIADATIDRIKHAMSHLSIGNPLALHHDIGPVIHQTAQLAIQTAIKDYHHCPIYQTPLPAETNQGSFIAPTLIELSDQDVLPDEIFGPVLFVKRFQNKQLNQALLQINQLKSGLTLGIQSRLKSTAEYIIQHTKVGNYYINRNQIGATVGCQPFGGSGRAGTGPKVGGPWSIWATCQNADPCKPHEIHPTITFNALTAIIRDWENDSEVNYLAALLRDVASRSPIGTQLKLPSITGESNVLAYRGLGRLLCTAEEPALLLELMCVALLTGNVAVIRYLPSPWRYALQNEAIEINTDPDLSNIDGVLCKSNFKNTHNPLCPIITPFENGHWPLFRLVAEYTVTTNTAAIGGDVELICLQDV